MPSEPSLPLPSVGVVLPAGGRGLRAGAPEPKQFLSLGGKPMLMHALEAFHRVDSVRAIVLVLPPEKLAAFSRLPADWPKVRLAAGGAERWESVRNGVAALDPGLPYVLIHDAARPFVSGEVIRRCLEALVPGAGVIAALPATDTVKEIRGGTVSNTLDRGKLILVQTPQGFPRALLDGIYAAGWSGAPPTDEAQMAERAGLPVHWVAGDAANRKVTGAEDLAWAEWMAGRFHG